jgi:murein DD-endopeptidase MepM/ murein hydrolase activator NlpD
VLSASWQGALGRAIRVRHGGGCVTVYGHLRGFAPGIGPGAEVRQNQVIGYVGSTGLATGPHLHYTLIQDGRAVDPMGFHNPAVEPLAAELLPVLERARLTWGPVLGGDPLTVTAAGPPAADATAPRRGV